MTDLEWIKRFTKITLSRICEQVGVDRTNLSKGKVDPEKIKQVKELMCKEYEELNEIYKKELSE
jgi:hypothetical protein